MKDPSIKSIDVLQEATMIISGETSANAFVVYVCLYVFSVFDCYH
jgi:hypothetical protein